MKLTAQELEQMKSVDIGAVSADALADVSGMAFDRTLPREERLARFVKRAVESDSISNQELLCKGWSHHLIHMTAVHLWQNGTLQLYERR